MKGGGGRKKKESRANDDRKRGRKKLPCLWFWFPEQRLQQFIIFLQAGPVRFNGRIKYALINEQLYNFMDGFNSFPCLELLEKKRLRQKIKQHELTGIDTEGANDIFTEVSKCANSLWTSEENQLSLRKNFWRPPELSESRQGIPRQKQKYVCLSGSCQLRQR